MKVNLDVYRRPEPCKRSLLSIAKSVTVLLIVAYFAIALLGMLAGPIGSAQDRQDRAEQMRDTKLSKEMRNDYQYQAR